MADFEPAPSIEPRPHLAAIVKQERLEGLRIASHLQSFFQKHNWNPGRIAAHGCVCTDVYLGPEISAMQAFGSPLTIASEPVHDRESGLPETEVQVVLEKLIALSAPSRLVRLSALETLQSIPKGEKFALITRLNLHPDYLETDTLIPFIQAAQAHLAPGGALLMTLQEPDDILSLHQVAHATAPLFSHTSVAPIEQVGSRISITALGAVAFWAVKAG